MVRAALIILGDDWPADRIGGLAWPDFRVRAAMKAGAQHIVVVAGRVTPDVVAAIDRAKGAGASATLVRSSADTGDLFHPDEAVLLMAGPGVVEGGLLDRLIVSERATLACLPPTADPDFELIDARGRWSGFARIDGATIRAIAPTVGDWDMASMLLREAVARRARRVMLDAPFAVLDARHRETPLLAARRLLADQSEPSGGWATRMLVDPVARGVLTATSPLWQAVARFAPLAALALFAVSIPLAHGVGASAAAALLVLGMLSAALGSRASQALGQTSLVGEWLGVVRNVAAVGALLALALPPAPDRIAILSIVLVAITALVDRLRADVSEPRWAADVFSHAIVVAIAAPFGALGLSIGLAAAAAHAFATLAAQQNSLSRALTQPR